MRNIFKKNKSIKWLLMSITIFLVVVVLLTAVAWLYDLRYQDRIFPGIKIADIAMGDKSIEQARVLLQAKIDNLSDKGIIIVYQNKKYKILPLVAVDKESSQVYELWSYDTDKIINRAYHLGRQGNFYKKSMDRLMLLLLNKKIKIDYKLNYEKLEDIIKNEFAKYEKPGKDAALLWKGNKVIISKEESGMVFDYDLVKEKLKNDLINIKSDLIELKLKVDQPKILKKEVEFLKVRANNLLKLAPLILKLTVPEYYQGRKKFNITEWYINKKQLKQWLKIKLNKDNQPVIGINNEIVNDYLIKIAAIVDTPAQDAKFNVENGKVIEWQSSEDGFVININETLEEIEKNILNNKKQKIDLVLAVKKSQLTNESVNNMGIRELIAVGESNFRGSPWNRRHNIKTGAEALNGLLIAPNEEFSLLKVLGDIDAASGYLPELVIKEGKTIPEYGGGLCQIGTTVFRLAINAGLPITERRNHSYRVGYYEPAGTDATIYDPWPDFKFINDNKNYLLLQTRIEGNKLIFEFWGTNDGRQVATTTPVIYNIVKPGEPEYIETDELKPGEKKRIEHAHNGADAYFKRIISWPQDITRETIEETWSSHYVPWRERWMVGIDPKKATTTEDESL